MFLLLSAHANLTGLTSRVSSTCDNLRSRYNIENSRDLRYHFAMSGNVREIEQAIRMLPRTNIEQLRNWIEDYLEDQLELSEAFEAKIENGKRDIAEGRVRTRQLDET